MNRLDINPVLLMVGAVVVIDLVCKDPITRILRRNRGEAYVGLFWLAVHVSKGKR